MLLPIEFVYYNFLSKYLGSLLLHKRFRCQRMRWIQPLSRQSHLHQQTRFICLQVQCRLQGEWYPMSRYNIRFSIFSQIITSSTFIRRKGTWLPTAEVEFNQWRNSDFHRIFTRLCVHFTHDFLKFQTMELAKRYPFKSLINLSDL